MFHNIVVVDPWLGRLVHRQVGLLFLRMSFGNGREAYIFHLPNTIDLVGGINLDNRRFHTPKISFFIPNFVSYKNKGMNQIITYLTFNGNCREAMEFYRECLGGELEIQTIEQTPDGKKFPENLKNLVVQAVLKKDDMLLMGSDMQEEELQRGNAAAILLQGRDEAKIRKYYTKLVVGGKPTHPLNENHWNDIAGGLTDRYGNRWLFYCNRRRQFKTRKNGAYKN